MSSNRDRSKSQLPKQTGSPINNSKLQGKHNKKVIKPASKPGSPAPVIAPVDQPLTVTATDAPAALCTDHRDKSTCPCNVSHENVWMIDCSSCNQYWHVDCLSLTGINGSTIDKMINYKCPFCYVAPVPTARTSESVCYICRNTLILQQSNSQHEVALSSQKTESMIKCCKLLNDIDFDDLSQRMETLGQFDQRLRHLLLSEHTLQSLDEQFRALSEQLDKHTDSSSMQAITTLISAHDHSLTSLAEQIKSLQHDLNNSPPTPCTGTSSNTDQLLERISSELRQICQNEDAISADLGHLKQSVIDLQQQATSAPPPPPAPIPAEALAAPAPPPVTPPTSLEPFSAYVEDFIDENTEQELIDFLDSLSPKFKQENGRSVLSFGHKYRYTGARALDPEPLPQILAPLVARLNREHGSMEMPINTVLVNKFEGPDSFLPQHSDNEPTINPGSSILTLSLGQACLVSFSRTNSDTKYAAINCAPRSLYKMCRKSQDIFEHRIDPGSVAAGTRYSLTFRVVSPLNRASTCILGDSNTCSLKFGVDPKTSFGKFLPGQQTYVPTLDHIDPYMCCGFNNVVLLCGINDIKHPSIKTPADIKRIFNRYVEKLTLIQTVNKRAHVFICPLLPTKSSELNRKVLSFNHLIFSQLLPTNFGVSLVSGFDSLVDENGLLSQHLSKRVNRFGNADYLHLNWKGTAKLASFIKNTVLFRVNGGRDRRNRRDRSRVNSTPYSTVAARSPAGQGLDGPDGYQP